jgi:hypothetical protein
MVELAEWTKLYAPYVGEDYLEKKMQIDELDRQGWRLAEEMWAKFDGTIEVRYWSESAGGFQDWFVRLQGD